MNTPEPDDPERADRVAREEKFRAAIAEHIQTVGSRNWKVLREKPEWAPYYGENAGVTADRQFWRLRAQVVRQNKVDKTRPHDGRRANETQREWADKVIEERRASDQPLSAIQAYWMAHGKDGEAKIDAAKAARQLLEDAQRLRDEAVNQQDSDKLAQAIKLLSQMLRFHMDIQPDLAVLSQQRAFVSGLAAALKRTFADDAEHLKLVSATLSAFFAEWGMPQDDEAA